MMLKQEFILKEGQVRNDFVACDTGVPGNDVGAGKTASIITSGLVSFVLHMMVF